MLMLDLAKQELPTLSFLSLHSLSHLSDSLKGRGLLSVLGEKESLSGKGVTEDRLGGRTPAWHGFSTSSIMYHPLMHPQLLLVPSFQQGQTLYSAAYDIWMKDPKIPN